jgi:Putative citrate transport
VAYLFAGIFMTIIPALAILKAGVAMPSFFGYMFKYSIPILIVLFILMTLVFF